MLLRPNNRFVCSILDSVQIPARMSSAHISTSLPRKRKAASPSAIQKEGSKSDSNGQKAMIWRRKGPAPPSPASDAAESKQGSDPSDKSRSKSRQRRARSKKPKRAAMTHFVSWRIQNQSVVDRLNAVQSRQQRRARSKKPKRAAMTHFLSWRIENQSVADGLNAVQADISSFDPHLSSALINPSKYHLTLAVFHIANDYALDTAIGVVDSIASTSKHEELFQRAQREPFRIEGLSTFGKRVLFAKVLDKDGHLPEVLRDISMAFYSELEDAGIAIPDQSFEPHITVWKASQGRRAFAEAKRAASASASSDSPMKPPRGIPPTSYATHVNTHFGTHNFESFSLCAMQKPKQESGYYFEETVVTLSSEN